MNSTTNTRNCFRKKGWFSPAYTLRRISRKIIELKNHPYFIAVQFHPEFKSKPHNAHPLFRDFIKAALERQK